MDKPVELSVRLVYPLSQLYVQGEPCYCDTPQDGPPLSSILISRYLLSPFLSYWLRCVTSLFNHIVPAALPISCGYI